MRKLSAVLILALALTFALPANTLLTNGVATSFVLPKATFSGQFFGGDLGYAIYVPPGATSLTIDLSPDVPTYSVDLLVRFSADVGLNGLTVLASDYVAAGGSGDKHIQINVHSAPPLQTGTYYIGFNAISTDIRPTLTLTATVEGGSVAPVRTVAASAFDKDLDGWLRSSTAANLTGGEPASSMSWQPSGGNPGGFAQYSAQGVGAYEALVAPSKFLGDLSGLADGRFEFDFMQLSGSEPVYPVEIRMFGAGAAFSWTGSVPPPAAINLDPCSRLQLNPATGTFDCVASENTWTHYTAPLQEAWWNRISGDAPFAQTLSRVDRLEVVTALSFTPGASGIDNFALKSRGPGPASTVLAGNTSFTSGADGWARNFPSSDVTGATTGNAASTLRWVPFEGNPGGYIRLNNSGGPNRDYLVVPARFVGDYRKLNKPQFEFDYQHNSAKGATLPVEMRLIGVSSVFVWTGGTPSSTWTHFTAPLTEAAWRRVSGTATLSDALAAVDRIEISMDQAEGPESNAIDNFWLLPGAIAPAPPSLTVIPSTVTFSALARGANPAAQAVALTSMAGAPEVSFKASASAGWLRLSINSGTTPRMLNISADTSNLPEGSYTAAVTVTPVGAPLGPQTIPITVKINARTSPLPRLNPGGVVNAASGRAVLAPGGLGTIYGTGLGPVKGLAAPFVPGTTYLPTRLQGIRVLVKETSGTSIAEAPVLYAADTQINFQLPFETVGRSEVLLVVDNDGAISDAQRVQIASNAPGIFTYGENRAVAVNEGGSVNSLQTPARRGSVLTVYMTGQGSVTPVVPTGSAAPERPLARAPFPAQASIGGASAQILFAGLAPGLVGVLQVNVVVPSAAPSGDSSLVVSIGASSSNVALVSVAGQ